jgi:hypothetical protein
MFLSIEFTLNADCSLVENKLTRAYDAYIKSKEFYNKHQYTKAYNNLQDSLLFSSDISKDILTLNYDCEAMIPGPYAPIVNYYTKTEQVSFERAKLGKMIKNFLNPNPFLLVEFQKSKTLVTVLNSSKTSRAKIDKQLPLEEFEVKIEHKKVIFTKIRTDESKTKVINKGYPINTKVVTSERFGFQLFN